MIRVAIVGDIGSGKTYISKLFGYPLFNADLQVSKIYRQKMFVNKIFKVFGLKNKKNIKFKIKNIIKKNKGEINKLEKIIHPLIRNQIKIFTRKNKKKKFIFFEIPLLIESKLMKNYDVIIFVNSTRKIRLKRHLKRGKNKEMFNLLDKRHLPPQKKTSGNQEKCVFSCVSHLIISN